MLATGLVAGLIAFRGTQFARNHHVNSRLTCLPLIHPNPPRLPLCRTWPQIPTSFDVTQPSNSSSSYRRMSIATGSIGKELKLECKPGYNLRKLEARRSFYNCTLDWTDRIVKACGGIAAAQRGCVLMADCRAPPPSCARCPSTTKCWQTPVDTLAEAKRACGAERIDEASRLYQGLGLYGSSPGSTASLMPSISAAQDVIFVVRMPCCAVWKLD
jgi:hypothetical protein